MASDQQEKKENGQDQVSRRGFIRTAGVATAGAAAVGLGARTSMAQMPGMPGRMPLTAPIDKLGFSPAEISGLTDNAKKLTKGDLLALSNWERTRSGTPPLHVNIADINSIEKAAQSMQERTHKPGAAQAQDVTACCCCCPCCSCASSVTQPVRPSTLSA
jgi:hypothetical protein